MSPADYSRIATPLAEQIATDENWQQATREPADTIDVMIHAADGETRAARDHTASVGASNVTDFGDVVFGTVRADRIMNLANGQSVRKVEERADPKPLSISEGVSTTNADLVHSEGFTGDGVTVVIIDLLFNPDQSEITEQVIDQIGGSSYFISGQSGLHGTACAEIVSEMLPDADLVLASAYGSPFPQLMDEITSAHDPDVMSMSLGFKPTSRIDGSDAYSQRIMEYTQATGSNTSEGGLFAVAAGNEGDGKHWSGPVQTNANDYVKFDDSGSTYLRIDKQATGEEVVVHSDVAWSSNDQGYKVELYDDTKTLVSAPNKTTTPAQTVSLPSSNPCYLRIKNDSLTNNNQLNIFAWYDISFTPSTAKGSIGVPATSTDSETLATAAVEHASDDLEAFSSRGPTQDGRQGIDIAAPDGTLSDTYDGDFYGTSAACPHVAGSAGLMMDVPEVTNTLAREALLSTARGIEDAAVSAPSNPKIGHGYVDVKAAYDSLSVSVEASGETISSPGQATITITGSYVDQIVVDELWTDWSVAATQNDGSAFTDNVSSAGQGTFAWDSTQSSASVSLTVDIPQRYVGGTYGISVEASQSNESTATTAQIHLS